jgi:predicted nucleic acid-binding protein
VVEPFAGLVEVLPYAAKAAQNQGGIRRAFEKAGQPVDTNDLHMPCTPAAKGSPWSATTCASLTVSGLLTVNWVDSLS